MRNLTFLLAASLVAAACSGGSESTTTTAGTMPPTSTTAPATTTTTVLPPTTTATTAPTTTTTTTTPSDADFVDIARDIGFDAPLSTLGLDVGDFDGDGDPDLMLLRRRGRSTIEIYRNDDGVFTKADFPAEAGIARSTCDWGDVQADGKLDLYCALLDGPNELWVQQEDGTFADEAESFGVAEAEDSSLAAVFASVDGDEFPELMVVNRTDRDAPESRSKLFANEGGESFTPAVGFESVAGLVRGGCLRVGDTDSDGTEELLDCGPRLVVVTATRRGYSQVGNRLGFGRRADGERWAAVATGDADGDGDTDVALVAPSQLVVHLRSDDGYGEPAFTFDLEDGRDVAFADANGDGFDDVYVVQRGCGGLAAPPEDGEAPPNAPDVLLLADGAGGFSEASIDQATGGCGDGVAAADVDGDGTAEFIVLNGYRRFEGPVQVISMAGQE